MSQLPLPSTGRDAAMRFVADHLGHLLVDEPVGSLRFTGGQSAADRALERFDIIGYDRQRSEVYPTPRRGASGLSPYIRHGMLTIDQVWNHVEGGPSDDVDKFRSELLWQEYARHWYARLGTRTRTGIRAEVPVASAAGRHGVPRPVPDATDGGYDRTMACLDLTLGELEEDGWLVNQSRLWLAGHWTARLGGDWRDGEDHFFRHLLDGSRAANRLGWQWTSGHSSTKAYSFSRWQVEQRAAGLCASCDLVHSCPIESWPDTPQLIPIEEPTSVRGGADTFAGPNEPEFAGDPHRVWLTAESLGMADPALVAHPDLPAVFVFDEPLLRGLELSGKRLVFLTETLAELGSRRRLELHLGEPEAVLAGQPVAVTHAPVPGFARRASAIGPAAVYPYPWKYRPAGGSVRSFSAWLRGVADPR